MKFRMCLVFLASVFLGGFGSNALAVKAGDLAPGIKVKTLKNYAKPEIILPEFTGKVVYVDFWASWCGPCRKSFPVLGKLHGQYKSQGFEVVGINLDENTKDADKFLSDFPVAFPLAADPAGKSATAFDVKGMPSAYLIDKLGVVRHIVVGFNDKEEKKIETLVKKLLAE